MEPIGPIEPISVPLYSISPYERGFSGENPVYNFNSQTLFDMFLHSLSMNKVFLNVPSFLWLNKAKVNSHDSPQRLENQYYFDDSSANKIYYVRFCLVYP